MGFLQIISGSGALALAFGSVTMATRNEFSWAFGLFWASAFFAVTTALWYSLTAQDPAILRIGSELVAAFYVGVILPALFRWLNGLKQKAGILHPNTSLGS
jgi:predicted outer membrane lipoprotein